MLVCGSFSREFSAICSEHIVSRAACNSQSRIAVPDWSFRHTDTVMVYTVVWIRSSCSTFDRDVLIVVIRASVVTHRTVFCYPWPTLCTWWIVPQGVIGLVGFISPKFIPRPVGHNLTLVPDGEPRSRDKRPGWLLLHTAIYSAADCDLQEPDNPSGDYPHPRQPSGWSA